MKNIRRIVCMIMILALSTCMVIPAMAETEFVASITYKQSQLISKAELGGEDVVNCLVATNIKAAKDKSTDIPQEARDLLIEVYESLEDGSAELPFEAGFVVREFVDVSFVCEDKDAHAEALAEEGNTIAVTFEISVAKDAAVAVACYVDGEWVEVEVVNNGDGSVTATFEDLCPVAIAVK